MGSQDSLDFLLAEHGKSVDLIQHYDNLRVSLMKFAFAYHSIVAAIALTAQRYGLFKEKSLILKAFPIFFLLLVFLVGLAIVLLLVQNRRYFVLAARQANMIRGALFDRGDLASSLQSILPTESASPRMFNAKSAHLITIFLLIVISSIPISCAVLLFAILKNLSANYCYLLALACGIVSLVLQLCYVRRSLREE